MPDNPMNFLQYKGDVEYNLARLEGQLARFELLIGKGGGLDEMQETLKMSKQFLASLCLALDPHRIDVI